jgi:uncharacterized protein
MSESWAGLPYYPISQFYHQHFGGRVRKISVTTAQSCPNREGLKGMRTCNFCDEWGSAAYPEKRAQSLTEQISGVKKLLLEHYGPARFLIYFQAYTNTFTKTAQLRSQFEQAFTFDDILGAVVGTRPDCISDAVLDLWREYAALKFLSVEIGVQSFSEAQLIWMRRGHTAEKSKQAIWRIRETVPSINLGIHLMFGWPGETDEDILSAAEECNRLPIENVKLHNLHVLKGTPLADEYASGRFQPVSQEKYFHHCQLFLQHLRPDIAVHRLAALANKPEELIAPAWTGLKMKTYQEFLNHMRAQTAYQGQLWSGGSWQ